jgi:hypothetical protein
VVLLTRNRRVADYKSYSTTNCLTVAAVDCKNCSTTNCSVPAVEVGWRNCLRTATNCLVVAVEEVVAGWRSHCSMMNCWTVVEVEEAVVAHWNCC